MRVGVKVTLMDEVELKSNRFKLMASPEPIVLTVSDSLQRGDKVKSDNNPALKIWNSDALRAVANSHELDSGVDDVGRILIGLDPLVIAVVSLTGVPESGREAMQLLQGRVALPGEDVLGLKPHRLLMIETALVWDDRTHRYSFAEPPRVVVLDIDPDANLTLADAIKNYVRLFVAPATRSRTK